MKYFELVVASAVQVAILLSSVQVACAQSCTRLKLLVYERGSNNSLHVECHQYDIGATVNPQNLGFLLNGKTPPSDCFSASEIPNMPPGNMNITFTSNCEGK